MRIISGKFKGRKIYPPKNLPSRPTTDRLKEGLFNVLQNRFDFTNLIVLDLYSGTGNISYEFASRGSLNITSVDKNRICVEFIKKTSLLFNTKINVIRTDSLNFLKNNVTALIGPSGCGKSTFLRCLNRMNDVIEICKIDGQICMNNIDIYSDEIEVEQLREKIGMVFQKPNPFPKSIYDNVAYGPRIHGFTDNKEELDEIVNTSLKKAGLFNEVKDRLDDLGTSLSGGQQQRLCIARAIAIKPEVILMDEPCSALDPIATSIIEELITELKKSYTIIIVTHSMQQAARVSDKTAFFHLGNLIEEGDTSKIFTKPDNQKTNDYITGRFG